MNWAQLNQSVKSATPTTTTPTITKGWASLNAVAKSITPTAVNKFGSDVSTHVMNPLNPNNQLNQPTPKVNVFGETLKGVIPTAFDFAKGLVKPFAELGVTGINEARNIGSLAKYAATGKPQTNYAQSSINLPILGKTNPMFTGQEKPTEMVGKVVGNALEIAPYFIGLPEVKGISKIIETIGQKSISEITAQEAKAFTIAYAKKVLLSSGTLGTMFGTGTSLKEGANAKKTAQNILQSSATIMAMEVFLSPVIGAVMKKGGSKPLETAVKEELTKTPEQMGFVTKPVPGKPATPAYTEGFTTKPVPGMPRITTPTELGNEAKFFGIDIAKSKLETINAKIDVFLQKLKDTPVTTLKKLGYLTSPNKMAANYTGDTVKFIKERLENIRTQANDIKNPLGVEAPITPETPIQAPITPNLPQNEAIKPKVALSTEIKTEGVKKPVTPKTAPTEAITGKLDKGTQNFLDNLKSRMATDVNGKPVDFNETLDWANKIAKADGRTKIEIKDLAEAASYKNQGESIFNPNPNAKYPNAVPDRLKEVGIIPKPQAVIDPLIQEAQKFNAFDKNKKLLGTVEAKDFYYAEDKAKAMFGDKYSHLMKEPSNPLIAEAKKYKSGEDFVNSLNEAAKKPDQFLSAKGNFDQAGYQKAIEDWRNHPLNKYFKELQDAGYEPTKEGVIKFYNDKVKSSTNPLIAEARKYKSAAEFVKAQPKLYHAGTADIKEVNLNKTNYNKTFYMSENADYAKSFGGKSSQLNEIVVNPEAKLADMRKPSTDLVSQIESKIQEKIAKNVPYGDKNFSFHPFSAKNVIQGIKDGKAHFAELPGVKTILKELGYDGQITAEVPYAKNIGVWNKDMVKTKSQLTDIFNQAHQAPKIQASGVSPIKEVKSKDITSPFGASLKEGIQKAKDNIVEYQKMLDDPKSDSETIGFAKRGIIGEQSYIAERTAQLEEANKLAKPEPAKTEVKSQEITGNKPSGVAKRIETGAIEMGLTKGFKDMVEYPPNVRAEQAKLISDVMNSDIELAKKMATGSEPLANGMRGEPLAYTMLKYAEKTRDGQLMKDLANSPYIGKVSEAGSTLSSVVGILEPDSAFAKIKELNSEMAKVAEKKLQGKTSSKVKAELTTGLKDAIKKSKPNKYSWNSFVDSIVC